MAGQRVIAQNRIPRVRISNRGIATPLGVWQAAPAGVGVGIGDVIWAPGTYQFAPVVNAGPITQGAQSFGFTVAQTAHGYSVGQQVAIANGVVIAGIMPLAIVTVCAVPGPNQWMFLWPTAATASGTGGSAIMSVQNLTQAASAVPSVPGMMFQDGLTTQALSVPPYGDLLAAQGPLTGKSVAANAVLTNAGAPNWNLIKSCVWKGAIYSATAGQQIAKRASLFAGPPTVLGFAALGFPTVALIPSQQGNFLMQAAGDSTPNVAVRIISNDTTASAVATGPAALTYFLHTLWEGAGGVLIALAGANSAIFRSTNVGASWTPIDAPNLGSRLWVAIWQSGANTYMLSQLGALATSTDAGATWGVVNTALPGAAAISTFQTTTIATSNNLPSVVLDQAGRRGYALMVGGAVTSWSLDTPTSGFITEVPANHFTVPATPTSAVYMFGTPLGLFVFNLAGGSRNGLWFAKFPATPGGMAPFTFATQQAGLPMYQAPSPPSGMDYIGGWGLTLGDGFIGFDNSSQSPGAVPASFGIADGITRFDRYAVTDPLLASGRKPFMRVL